MSYFDCSDAEGLDLGDHPDDELVVRASPMPSRSGFGCDIECDVCVKEYCACEDPRFDAEVTEVTEMDPSPFDAANGGEENDDMDPDKLIEGGSLSLEQQQQIVNDWIDAAPVRELKRIKIRVDLVVAQRRAVLEQESKELAAWEKPVRARRSDAGRPRQKPANEVARDEKGVAV